MTLISVSESGSVSESTSSFDSAGSPISQTPHTRHTSPSASIAELPEDILLFLIEYLDLRSISRFSQTCRRIQRICSTLTGSLAAVRMAAKDIPFPDPFLINAPISYPLLKERLAKCARFHKAWKTKSEDSSPLAMNIPSPSDSPNLSSITDPANTLPENLSLPNSNLSNHSNRISTSIIRQFDIPEKVCMIRILPGGQYIVVIDFEENAQFYEVLTGKQVGRQSFSEIAKSEVIYSIDFTVHSKTTVVWGLLTSGMNPHGGDNSSQSKLCVRAIIIHFPEFGQEDRALGFEPVLVHPTEGTPEMLSISGSYMAAYTYRESDRTPTLTVWNWEQGMHATYSVPWELNKRQADYAGHPSLHATPKAVFLIGGQLGFHRLHADGGGPEDWAYNKAVTVVSTQQDADTLIYSSQGRCSKPWWGISGRPWHRLVASPIRVHSEDDEDDARTLNVVSFEVPDHPEDTEARLSYIDLGKHRIVPGQESSPQLYHISRFGSKAIWLCQRSQNTEQDRENLTVQQAEEKEDEKEEEKEDEKGDEKKDMNESENRNEERTTVTNGPNISIQSVALPTFEQQMAGELPGPVKWIDLGSQVDMNKLRAFDMDETAPLFAVAEEQKLWLVEIGNEV